MIKGFNAWFMYTQRLKLSSTNFVAKLCDVKKLNK